MSDQSPEHKAPSETPRRRSRVPHLFVFFAGILIGRIASEQFSPRPLNALDLVMYAGLAFSIAWAWRSWARGTMEQRARSARRRAERRASNSRGADGAGPDRASRTRRRRR